MSLSSMTFHEAYGALPKSTLRLIRRYNVSQSDYDGLLAVFGWEHDEEDLIDFHKVNAMIEAGSSSGTYRPSRYL